MGCTDVGGTSDTTRTEPKSIQRNLVVFWIEIIEMNQDVTLGVTSETTYGKRFLIGVSEICVVPGWHLPGRA